MTFCNVWATQRSNHRCPMRFWGRHAPVGPLGRDPRDPRPRDTQRAADSNTNTDGITLEARNWGGKIAKGRDDCVVRDCDWLWRTIALQFFSWSIVYFRLSESASCTWVDDSYVGHFQFHFAFKNFWRGFLIIFGWPLCPLPNVSRFHLFAHADKIKPNRVFTGQMNIYQRQLFPLVSPNGFCIFILPGSVWYFQHFFPFQKRCQIFSVCPTALPNLIGRDGCYFGFGGRGHSGTCTGLS